MCATNNDLDTVLVDNENGETTVGAIFKRQWLVIQVEFIYGADLEWWVLE